MRRLEVKPGDRFGRLTVINETRILIDNGARRRRFWMQCDCGKKCIVRLLSLTSNNTQSCGCLYREKFTNRTHGYAGTPTYVIWADMIQRCQNPRRKSYKHYGGRGIKVCERWHKFENFLADMGERPGPYHQLNRLNNDGNYEPGNVEWTDDLGAQARNKGKRSNMASEYRGVSRERGERWCARIYIDGREHYLGGFDSEEDAARAYDSVTRRHKGYHLNFPSGN